MKEIKKSMIILTIVLVIFSVMVFGLIEYVMYGVIKKSAAYDPILSIGMIVPMGLILGFVNYKILKKINTYFSKLMVGIDQIASGNFDTRLDINKAGSFKNVFNNFNNMCRELQGVQTLRNDFINQFSHEFKTPIMAINGFSNLLLEKELDRSEQAVYLNIIASESKRLGNLSTNTLLLAKLESQQLITNKEAFYLDEQLKQVLILLEPQWSKKSLEINCDLFELQFWGNKDIMKQLWINLINNAIKFSNKNSEIKITLDVTKNNYVVCIGDRGEGISSEELPLIFDKYYKGTSTSSADGLGLTIVKKIIELCNGEIEFTSNIDVGTTIKVSLPINKNSLVPILEPKNI